MADEKKQDVVITVDIADKIRQEFQAHVEYLQRDVNELRAIVRQITTGVKIGEAEYIHPADLGDVLNSDASLIEIVHAISNNGKDDVISLRGRLFKQSVNAPRKSLTKD